MSTQAALNFISKWRQMDAELKSLDYMSSPDSLSDLLETAKVLGFEFTHEEFREAHAIDWRLRYLRFGLSGNQESDR